MKLRNLIFMALFGLCVLSCGKDDDPTPTPNENNAPDYGDNQSVTVSEAISDTYVIGTYTATDADEEDVLVYSTNSSVFEIDAESGQLSLADGQSLDADDSPYSVTLTVSDSEATDSITVTIIVTEGESTVNEPPVMEDQEFSVDEDVADDFSIATVIATDEDSETLTYAIITNSDDLFEIAEDGTLSLADGAGLDAWENDSHEIIISVSDEENTVDATITINVNDTRSFITTWKTTLNDENIGFGTDGNGTYSYIVDWGDGTIEEFDVNTSPFHYYDIADTYTVKIRAESFPKIIMDNHFAQTKLTSIQQWGDIQWKSFENAFEGCTNMEYNATDAPDLSQVTSLWAMFYGCSSFNGDLSNWDVSGITNMGNMFFGATSFNGDISNWNVSEVTTMYFMFRWATSFNGDISEWEVLKVKNMAAMFGDAHAFDQSLGNWDITSATNLYDMLNNCGMDSDNYNATLIGWADLATVPSNIWLGANGRVHCDEGTVARNFLIDNKEWQFNDDSSCLE
ncbi:BspA family leucine-rich repeat surface protein [Flagellimonas sp.]|uniref:BspA family leucine-rich repeat surface protein n=1 Tax=Flagellimonas sp. TaxID=2058762 RepID=UPI003BAE369B